MGERDKVIKEKPCWWVVVSGGGWDGGGNGGRREGRGEWMGIG